MEELSWTLRPQTQWSFPPASAFFAEAFMDEWYYGVTGVDVREH